MMTRLEQETYEVAEHCLPRIATALESIAKSLEVLRGNQSEHKEPRSEYGKAGD